MSQRFIAFGATATFMLGVSALLERFYFRLGLLPETAYFSNSIVGSVLGQLPLTLFLLANGLILIWQRKSLRWDNLAPQAIRWLIVLIAVMIAWAFSTYQYNVYYDQPHHLDRLILLLLPLLLYWHPAWVPAFLVVAISMTYQFHYPFGRFTWTDKRLLYELLILFHAFLLVQVGVSQLKAWSGKDTKRRSKQLHTVTASLLHNLSPFHVFLFLLLCLHAATYLNPALLKLELNWLRYDQLSNLFAASYLNGWLAHWPEARIVALANIVAQINPLLLIFTLITELGVIAMFVHRRAPQWLFAGAIMLHIGIFLSSGIFFWKWVVLNLALIWVLWALEHSAEKFPFTRATFFLSLLFIPLSIVIWRPIQLGWYDTPLVHTYELEGIGISGTHYEIPRAMMAPYDVLFAQNRFSYLREKPLVIGTYGATLDRELLLRTTDEAFEYTAVVADFGRDRSNPDAAARFDQFIKTFFGNLNRRGTNTFLWHTFPAPHHIWNMAKGEAPYHLQEPLQTVRVQFTTTYFDGKQFKLLENETIREIEIQHD
ncbi:MAG: hypothetical protein ACPG8W_24005 [Candidatus Promineifilaceae bacterium]